MFQILILGRSGSIGSSYDLSKIHEKWPMARNDAVATKEIGGAFGTRCNESFPSVVPMCETTSISLSPRGHRPRSNGRERNAWAFGAGVLRRFLFLSPSVTEHARARTRTRLRKGVPKEIDTTWGHEIFITRRYRTLLICSKAHLRPKKRAAHRGINH